MSLGVSGDGVVVTVPVSIAFFRGRRVAFGAGGGAATTGAGAAAAIAGLRAVTLRAVGVALARAEVAFFAGLATALRAVALGADLRVAGLVAAAAARFVAGLRAAGFARLAGAFFAVTRLAGAFFAATFFTTLRAVFFAGVFVAAFLVVFAAAFGLATVFARAPVAAFAVFGLAFGPGLARVFMAAFAVVLRAPVPRAARALGARRVVARTASGCAPGCPLLLSSLLTSGFSLSAVDGSRWPSWWPLSRPDPQDARLTLEDRASRILRQTATRVVAPRGSPHRHGASRA